MKSNIALLISILILLAVLVSGQWTPSSSEVIRIHIRANSNLDSDQSVKYEVKDAVVRYMTPLIAHCSSRDEIYQTVSDNLTDIQTVADRVLRDRGLPYTSRARLTEEYFPYRAYSDDYALQEGVYDALIVELGSGDGDNWWCVLYPPLCFVPSSYDGTDAIRYKSKILELIESFRT